MTDTTSIRFLAALLLASAACGDITVPSDPATEIEPEPAPDLDAGDDGGNGGAGIDAEDVAGGEDAPDPDAGADDGDGALPEVVDDVSEDAGPPDATGCLFGDDAACDDGIPCTVDACNAAGACVHTAPAAKESGCDDGLFCNGPEVCDPTAGCVAGPPPEPPNDLPGDCTAVGACDEESDSFLPVLLTAGEPCEDGDLCTDGESCDAGGTCSGGKDTCAAGVLTPAAPSAAAFLWQGRQDLLVDSVKGLCVTGTVALAVAETAVCYGSAPDGVLLCAGRIYDEELGPAFVSLELPSVDQVAVSGELGGPFTSSLLARSSATGHVHVFGPNESGMFGTGGAEAVGDLASFGLGELPPMLAFAVGGWTKLCALADTGVVYCAGGELGSSPVKVGPAKKVWIDPKDAHHLDDANVWRAAAGVSDCQVKKLGLFCDGFPTVGNAGEVVDGRTTRHLDPATSFVDVCHLSSAGKVSCRVQTATGTKTVSQFTKAPVLAFAADPATSARCAVYGDGSLWCLGDNTSGKLGTGGEKPLQVETEVAPPGSVRIGCP